jgi:hypothetical protein
MAENAGKWGGKRSNSGRKLGSVQKKIRAELAAVSENGRMPIDYALSIMNNEKETYERRFAACALVMPFIHPRLNAIAMAHTNAEPIKEITWRILPAPSASLIEHRESEVEEG